MNGILLSLLGLLITAGVKYLLGKYQTDHAVKQAEELGYTKAQQAATDTVNTAKDKAEEVEDEIAAVEKPADIIDRL